MNITDLLLGNQNTDAVSQLARKLGINEEQARAAIEQLAPSLSRGLQHRTKSDNGLGGLLDALQKDTHSRYLDKPDLLGKQDTVEDGNSILGHIFGNKDVSRNVAKHAGEQTSLGATLMKKALPIVAAMVMGSLSKSIFGGGQAPARQESGGLLSSLLDTDNDGSVIDDVLGMAFKAALG